MSRLLAPGWLAAAHLTVTAVAVIWNVVIAGRISRWRSAPRAIALLSALAGLLIAPAVLIAVATGSSLVGRSIYAIAWVWPVTALIIAAQAVVATARGHVPVLSGVPVAAYDLLVATVAVARYLSFLGVQLPYGAAVLVAADTSALALGAHPEAALLPIYLHVPLLAPAVTARRWRLAIAVRAMLAVAAATWTALVAIGVPHAREAIRGYARFAGDRPQERPQGDFTIGLKLFPVLAGDGPPPLAIANDLEMARQIDAQLVSVYLEPRHVSAPLLDSLAHSLDELRRGGARLAVALDAGDGPPPRGVSFERWRRARVAEVEAIVRRLRPDYLVPAVTGPGLRPRVLLSRWTSYLSAAAAASHRVRPRTRVLLFVGGYGVRDSALYAWGTRASSGIDALGVRALPAANGAVSLDARLAAAERWMRAHPSPKEHWVVEAGGLPLAHGERSQALAIWRTVSWATRHPQVKGVIIYEASDYEAPLGLRATGGRVRPAAATAAQLVRMMRESVPAP